MAKTLIRGSQIDWQQGPFPATRMKLYPAPVGGGAFSLLLEIGATARLDRHREPLNEIDYVISGSLEIEGERLEAGDYLFTPAGEEHGPYRSAERCLVFITKF